MQRHNRRAPIPREPHAQRRIVRREHQPRRLPLRATERIHLLWRRAPRDVLVGGSLHAAELRTDCDEPGFVGRDVGGLPRGEARGVAVVGALERV